MNMQTYLEKLPYYSHLTDEQKQTTLNYWVKRSYKKGEIIHGLSAKCLGQIFMVSGEVRLYIVSEDGREITLFKIKQYDTCVLSADCVISQISFETQIVAETDCEILVLGSGIISKLAEENIYVKCYMYELLTERFSSVMFTMQQIIFMGFDRRLASFLVSEYERTGTKDIRMTHDEIAKNTNSAREVVARMLKRFSNDGLVDYKRGVITLKDIDALYDLI